MANLNGQAYGLTTLCPIQNLSRDNRAYAALLREHLDNLPTDAQSPMSAVPETYLCRYYVLDDLPYQGADLLKLWPQPVVPKQESLKSSYLVFSSNFHGTQLEPYLLGMWRHAEAFVRKTWQYCVGFSEVRDGDAFAAYIKRCQVETTFYFNGSTDESLAEQLKGLYLKQELSKFAFENQGRSPSELQRAFADFVQRTRPLDVAFPSWIPGASDPNSAVTLRDPRGRPGTTAHASTPPDTADSDAIDPVSEIAQTSRSDGARADDGAKPSKRSEVA